MSPSDTFPKLLLQNAERLGERAALREKDLGIWRETSWRRYGERVRDFSLGLVALGLQRGGKFVIAEDQEQVDKILGMIEQLPKITHLVYSDPRGLRRYSHDKLISFEEVERRGRELHAQRTEMLDQNVAQGKGGDLAMICYTSGTT